MLIELAAIVDWPETVRADGYGVAAEGIEGSRKPTPGVASLIVIGGPLNDVPAPAATAAISATLAAATKTPTRDFSTLIVAGRLIGAYLAFRFAIAAIVFLPEISSSWSWYV